VINVENVINSFRTLFKDKNEFEEFKFTITGLKNIIEVLGYADVQGIYADKDWKGDCIVFYLRYKKKDLNYIMNCSQRVHQFLRKQNPKIVKMIKIRTTFPKEMMVSEGGN